MEDYFFDVENRVNTDKVFVLIIYDIIDNRRRIKFAKYLQGYGFRIQKSAFEAVISKKKYEKLLKEIPSYIVSDDNIKVYKIIGKGQVTSFGSAFCIEDEDVIIV
ncbi:MAG: CRISPR-associated endonuclease Cas2 [Lachnospiraceae bacterium]|nr:CRISPR-associated endonuclease Cas2 [Lachnospiraceae bacterium]